MKSRLTDERLVRQLPPETHPYAPRGGPLRPETIASRLASGGRLVELQGVDLARAQAWFRETYPEFTADRPNLLKRSWAPKEFVRPPAVDSNPK